MGWANAGGWSGRGWSKAAAAAAFHANAVHLDGSTTWLSKSSSVATSGTKGIVSLWIKGSVSGATQVLYKHNFTGRVLIYISTLDDLAITCATSSDVTIVSMATSGGALGTTGAWHHILASWDVTGTPAGKIYIDGVDKTGASPTLTTGTISYADTDLSFGASSGGTSKFTGDVSEFYFNMAEYLDLTSSTNVAKFRSGTKPVSLGADGSTPTGTAPVIYLGNATATWQNNLGTGGNFTVNGTLTTASTSPSD